MRGFESNFKIKSSQDTLTQLLLQSIHNYNTISNGIKSSYSIFTKAKYDIYTLNESSPDKDKNYYITKYTTSITINSLCTKFSFNSSENDCEFKSYLDLNLKNSNNLRMNDDDKLNKEEIIKNAILPICIIEHTDTNIILSLTCPDTLAENLKNDIILAFQNIKQDSTKGLNEEKDIAGTKIEEKEEKIYINLYDKVCSDYDGNPSKNITCEINKNIVTDKEGNLISNKIVSSIETIKDENNTYSNNTIYIIEDVSKNSDNFNPENYKSNLNSILDLTKSFLKKESYISEGSFDKILEYFLKEENNNNTENSIRNLLDEESNYFFDINEAVVFQKIVNDITMKINYKNNIGLENLENAYAITIFNIEEKSQGFSFKEVDTKLSENINKFISLSKAGNRMANSLYEKINQPLLDLRDKIYSNINELNNILAYSDLLSIFDSTYIMNEINNISYDFVFAAQNLYNGLNELNSDLPLIIDDTRKTLKKK